MLSCSPTVLLVTTFYSLLLSCSGENLTRSSVSFPNSLSNRSPFRPGTWMLCLSFLVLLVLVFVSCRSKVAVCIMSTFCMPCFSGLLLVRQPVKDVAVGPILRVANIVALTQGYLFHLAVVLLVCLRDIREVDCSLLWCQAMGIGALTFCVGVCSAIHTVKMKVSLVNTWKQGKMTVACLGRSYFMALMVLVVAVAVAGRDGMTWCDFCFVLDCCGSRSLMQRFHFLPFSFVFFH